MSNFSTPALAKWGFIAGLVIGLLSGNGIWSIVLGLSLLWIGNAVSGLLAGEIFNHAGLYSNHYVRHDRPLEYWLNVILELILGLMALVAFFKQPV